MKRNQAKRILILCEDAKSSKMYFESFKKDPELRRHLAALEVFHPKNYNPVGLVNEAKKKKKKAKKERNEYDEIWVVLDKDGHAKVGDTIETAKANGIKVALSVICFEYWVLLHFEKTTKPFSKGDEIVSYFKKKKYLKNYQKNLCCYETLKDRLPTAITNAKWLAKQNQNDIDRGVKIHDLEAHTDVHILVEKLINLKVNDFLKS